MNLQKNKRPRRFGAFRVRKNTTQKETRPKLSSTIKRDLFNIPNSITMIRIVFIPFVVVCLAMKTPFYCLLSVAAFSIAAISDFFDGYLARKLNLVSVTGKFLDPLADKLMVMAATVQLAAMDSHRHLDARTRRSRIATNRRRRRTRHRRRIGRKTQNGTTTRRARRLARALYLPN